jgi:predicted DCC family thiol-disulfide oxidoreductase YuxK
MGVINIPNQSKAKKFYFVYDGDCRFCHRTAVWLNKDITSFQSIQSQFAGEMFSKFKIDPLRANREAIWISIEGEVKYGPFAISAALAHGTLVRQIMAKIIDFYFFKIPVKFFYARIARRRKFFWVGKSSCAVNSFPIADNYELKNIDVPKYIYIYFVSIIATRLFIYFADF